MDAFDQAIGSYRALQVSTQDVWAALDRRRNGRAAFNSTTWRTATISVPSRTGWDIGTSLALGRHEFNMNTP